MVKIVAMGDNVVDCYLARGEMFPGGNCLNVAVFVRRYGGDAAYIGAIGRDEAGELIWRTLGLEGVDISHLRCLDGATAYCLIDHQGHERVFVDFDLGVSVFSPSGDDFDFITGFDCVHIGQSSGLDAYLEIISRQVRLSYDFSDKYDDGKITKIAPLCLLASLSSREEGRNYALHLVHNVLKKGAQYCLVTRGKNGAILGYDQELIEVEADKTDLVDTLGAGDCFIARTLLGILQGESPTQFLPLAARAAALTCSHYGAFGHGVMLNEAMKQLVGACENLIRFDTQEKNK